MSRRVRLAAPLLVLAALTVSACGTEPPTAGNAPAANAPAGDSAGDPAASAPAPDAGSGGDPCALLTADQAKKALKVAKVGPGEITNGQCIYASVPAVPIENIGVGRNDQASNEAELKALIEQGNSSGFSAEEVGGIGDAAYLIADANILHVVVDGTPYVVTGLTDRGALTSAAKSLVANVS
jgi:hypothetical protein